MEPEFWFDSWESGGTKTSFHVKEFHRHVMAHTPADALAGKRVLVPLCGKTHDLLWFAEHAAEVIGIELVPKAIEQFFTENDRPFERHGNRFRSGNIEILNADILTVSAQEIGKFDIVYDRAALVALPDEMRARYVARISELSPAGSIQLLNTIEYGPAMDSPPFSVSPADVRRYYGELYDIEVADTTELPGHRMVEKFSLDFFFEHAFLLTRRS